MTPNPTQDENATRVASLMQDKFNCSHLDAALVCGSGLSGLAASLDAELVSFADLTLPVPSVPGHTPSAALVRINGKNVAIFFGRVHLYEGYTAKEVTRAASAATLLGASTVLLTNAAGAISHELEVGKFCVIEDHLNLTGTNPLFAESPSATPPNFLDLSRLYNPALTAELATALDALSGVYAALPGPSYETPAEVRALRALGADLAGMSTVLEAIAAHAAGATVAALSLVTNIAASKESTLSHEEVTRTSAQSADYVISSLHTALNVITSRDPAP